MKHNQLHPVADERIQDKAYDLLGEMILEQEANDAMLELQREQLSGHSNEMEAFFEKNDHLFLRKIETAYNKSLWRKRNEIFFSKVTQIAALIIIGVFALGTVTVAASEDLRIQLLKLLTWTTDKYTAIELIQATEYVTVPEEWAGSYYPGYIPEGLSLAQCLPDSVTYWKDGDIATSVHFSEHTVHTRANLDTEDAVISSITVQGMPAQMSQKYHRIMIWWAAEDRLFTLTTKGYDVDTALQIANSIEKIK